MPIPMENSFHRLKLYAKEVLKVRTHIKILKEELKRIGWSIDNIGLRLAVYHQLGHAYEEYELGLMLISYLKQDILENVNLTG